MKSNDKSFTQFSLPMVIGSLLFLLFVQSCSLGNPAQTQPNPTLTALSERIARTATAAAEEDDSPDGSLAAAQLEATEKSRSIEETRAADASSRDVSALATATITAPMLAELPFYGVEPSKGQLGWLHDPVTLEIEGYQQYNYANDYMQVVVRDFVMAADITWDTQYGTSGCGFMLRSNGDQNKPDQYMVITTRFGNGHVIFNALADGEIANIRDFYANYLDPQFEWQNGTTNRLAIVGRANILEIFTNGIKIGEVDTTQPPPRPVLPAKPSVPIDTSDQQAVKRYQDELNEYQGLVDKIQKNYSLASINFDPAEAVFDQGFVAMLALSESGRTICHFDNAWLWHIDS